ncbi:hypothetical protein N7366_24980 [Aeromonas caviae]|uniref:Uncharacterized protein n=1 Tax=Aeromonas caviae TaxID=648 RepID=A0AA42UE84_AERCA|nr:hypothetical protein [Aeromonas caviae]MDH0436417.1 hypothetical protein [Aeromonas caviae]MDH0477386.1 hypothetical protein [Aeromonas caviae]MDH0939098.1 hypothetical protein [Aeromonas caviae]MDH1399890.1 hypothetical protein [Aeromonas caviae]MDH1506500.1 hypothetical protein [Aeromonas caviae]
MNNQKVRSMEITVKSVKHEAFTEADYDTAVDVTSSYVNATTALFHVTVGLTGYYFELFKEHVVTSGYSYLPEDNYRVVRNSESDSTSSSMHCNAWVCYDYDSSDPSVDGEDVWLSCYMNEIANELSDAWDGKCEGETILVNPNVFIPAFDEAFNIWLRSIS